MSSFTLPMVITPAPEAGPRMWRYARDMAVWIGKGEPVWWLRVRAGDLTDLGTIPTLLWWLLPPHDPRFAPMYGAHDDACRRLPRIIADALIIDLGFVLARKHRAGLWRPVAMYLGVRCFVTARAAGRALVSLLKGPSL